VFSFVLNFGIEINLIYIKILCANTVFKSTCKCTPAKGLLIVLKSMFVKFAFRLPFKTRNREHSLFGPKRDEVTEEWRKLHDEELNDLYSLPNIVRVVKPRQMRWAVHVARMGEDRGMHRVLVGKTEGKRPLGR
jgi:hypothetical protein